MMYATACDLITHPNTGCMRRTVKPKKLPHDQPRTSQTSRISTVQESKRDRKLVRELVSVGDKSISGTIRFLDISQSSFFIVWIFPFSILVHLVVRPAILLKIFSDFWMCHRCWLGFKYQVFWNGKMISKNAWHDWSSCPCWYHPQQRHCRNNPLKCSPQGPNPPTVTLIESRVKFANPLPSRTEENAETSLTFSSVSIRAIVYQNVVERLLVFLRQILNAHLTFPVLRGGADRIPSSNDTGIVIPKQESLRIKDRK